MNLWAAVVVFGAALGLARADVMPLPPAAEEFVSPGGGHVLVIESPDEWASKRSRAALYRVRDGRRTVLWTKELPHEYRPRAAFVGPGGEVLLLDEWINVLSRLSLVYLTPTGDVTIEKSFHDIAELLDTPASTIVSRANFGPWMSARPEVEQNGAVVTIPTAGKTLRVNMHDGSLTVG